ncbi:MAG: MFS transporter [Phycisphaerales bacterium]|jgi:MFS family permease|nr:MFS transporter [Phycisphaeraceae bacterium]
MIDGTAYSVMVGVGELFIPAFALALSMGEVVSGLIATAPALIGASLQLLSAQGVRWLGSHKRWTVLMAGIQAASFAPLIVAAMIGPIPAWALLLAASIYWASGQSAGSAWSTWIGTNVPRPVRARFFGLRSRSLQAGTLAGFLLGGAALGMATNWQPLRQIADPASALPYFAIIFALALLCRALSTALLMRQTERDPLPSGMRYVSPLQMIRRFRSQKSGHDGRLIFYMLCVTFAANVSAPFMNPYFLEHQGRSYIVYAALVGTVLLGKVLALGLLGKIARRSGPIPLLLVGGIGVAPISVLVLLSDNIYYILLIQLFSGVVWACFELATWLLFLDHLPEEERTAILSSYFFFNTLAMTLGSLLGGWILAVLGKDFNAYFWAFSLSTFLRFTTVILLWKLLRVLKNEPPAEVKPENLDGPESAAWIDERSIGK